MNDCNLFDFEKVVKNLGLSDNDAHKYIQSIHNGIDISKSPSDLCCRMHIVLSKNSKESLYNLDEDDDITPIQKTVNSVLRSCYICKEKTRNAIPCGYSKLGGLPDVSDDFVWPVNLENKPLQFLCQINLNSFCNQFKNAPFPHNGMLYFFYEDGNYNNDKKQYLSSYRVIYDKKTDLCRFENSDNINYNSKYYDETALEFKEVKSIPCYNRFLSHYNINKEYVDEEDYNEFIRQFEDYDKEIDCPIKLLGYADCLGDKSDNFDCILKYAVYDKLKMLEYKISDDIRTELKKIGKEWTLLFQTNIGLDKIDMKSDITNKRLYYFINKDQLSKQIFSNCILCEQYY